jgi:hypothetical protein
LTLPPGIMAPVWSLTVPWMVPLPLIWPEAASQFPQSKINSRLESVKVKEARSPTEKQGVRNCLGIDWHDGEIIIDRLSHGNWAHH